MITRSDVDEHGEIQDVTTPMPGALAPGAKLHYALMDELSETGLTTIEQLRPEWLATISAGYKKKNDAGVEYPVVERGGIIHIQAGDEKKAPGLAQALQATGGKKLTIAFMADPIVHADGFVDVSPLLTQRLVRYSRSSLEVFGDHTKLTEVKIEKKGDGMEARFIPYYPGSKGYADLVKTCKPETSVFFCLARWDGREPVMIWPDGMMPYRIRFTSKNSGRSIVGRIINLLPYTGGHIMGLPFELSLGARDVAGRDPKKGFARHTIPIWEINLAVPGGMEISGASFREVVNRSIKAAAVLRALPTPTYTVEHALLEAPTPDMDEIDDAELERALANDPPCDAEYFRKHFHAMVANDPLLSTDAGRHRFVKRFTSERWPEQVERHTESLEAFMATASESDANALISKAADALTALDLQRRQKRMQQGGAKPAEKPKDPEPTEPASAPAPAESAPEEEQPIAATDDGVLKKMGAEALYHMGPEAQAEYEASQLDEPPFDDASVLEGEWSEAAGDEPVTRIGPNTSVEPGTSGVVEDTTSVRLVTTKQVADIEQWVSPGRRASLDYSTLTEDEAALLLDEYRPRR